MPDTARPPVRAVSEAASGAAAAASAAAPIAAPAVVRLVALLGACATLAGCSTMHVKRATYQMLRQEDCRLNQLESFCRRNFANEYHEYERLRRTFMRESTEETWRASGRDAAIAAVVASSAPVAASTSAAPGGAGLDAVPSASALRTPSEPFAAPGRDAGAALADDPLR